jgi:hypothetical protein
MEPLAHRSLSGTPCSLLDDKSKCTKTESEAHHVKVDRTVQCSPGPKLGKRQNRGKSPALEYPSSSPAALAPVLHLQRVAYCSADHY